LIALHPQFAHLIARIEALHEKQVASGKAIEGLFEGLMRREFCGRIGGVKINQNEP